MLALVASAAVGLFNGFVTVLLNVPSFVTTLGSLFILNGLTLTISRGFPATTPGGPVADRDHGRRAPIPRSSGRSPSSR